MLLIFGLGEPGNWGKKFLMSLVGWDSVKGDKNEDEGEAKSEDRINTN